MRPIQTTNPSPTPNHTNKYTNKYRVVDLKGVRLADVVCGQHDALLVKRNRALRTVGRVAVLHNTVSTKGRQEKTHENTIQTPIGTTPSQPKPGTMSATAADHPRLAFQHPPRMPRGPHSELAGDNQVSKSRAANLVVTKATIRVKAKISETPVFHNFAAA